MFDVYWALVGFFLIFGVVLFTIFRKRRKYQPIKSRSMAVSFYYLLCLEISLVIFCFHNSDVFDVKCISFWYVLIVGQNTLIALSSARAIRLYYLFLLNKRKLESAKGFLVITTFLIRKIKDTYKTKNEINMSIINLCLYILFLYLPIYPESNYDHIRWEFLFLTLFQFMITFAYPIYWSTCFEKSKQQIKKDNQSDGASNSSTFHKFQKIIEGAETVQYWINYSKLNYSVENILFYRTFKAFKSLKKNKKKKKYSKMIEYMLKNFIENNSPLIINISSHVRNNIIDTCKKEVEEEIPDNVFDAAFNEIVNLMFTDTWPQFLESKLYFEMILKVEQINPDQYLKLQNIDADEEQEDENNLNLNKLNLSTRESSSSTTTEEEN